MLVAQWHDDTASNTIELNSVLLNGVLRLLPDGGRAVSFTADPYTGCFLVATPIITSPPFWRTVIFVLTHDEDGTVGVILNTPTELAAENYIEGVTGRLSAPELVFIGGPVQPETAIAVARPGTSDSVDTIADSGIGTVDLTANLEFLHDLRIFAGYAGWDSQQLALEMQEGAWWVVRCDPSEVFTDEIEDMWRRCVQRAPGNIPLYRTYPADPTEN